MRSNATTHVSVFFRITSPLLKVIAVSSNFDDLVYFQVTSDKNNTEKHNGQEQNYDYTDGSR
jgi:hypothetical protein